MEIWILIYKVKKAKVNITVKKCLISGLYSYGGILLNMCACAFTHVVYFILNDSMSNKIKIWEWIMLSWG